MSFPFRILFVLEEGLYKFEGERGPYFEERRASILRCLYQGLVWIVFYLTHRGLCGIDPNPAQCRL